jgi:hypothetical protein
MTSVPALRQAPMPSQVPSWPHVPPWGSQSLSGSVPDLMGAQTPSVRPVEEARQEAHLAVQGPSQQRPSAQAPEAHSPAPPQGWPRPFLPAHIFVPGSQKEPVMQSPSFAHWLLQRVAPQA